MERDSVLKLSITVKLIKSENDEKLCITALSFPDPQSTKLSIDICLSLSRGIDRTSVINST